MARRTPEQYDWQRLEFDQTLLTKHFTPMRTFEKKYVVVHHMTIVGTGDGDALDACWNTWQKRKASAHYGVDGHLVRQYVYDKDFAWATGSNAGNLYGISIEHANQSRDPKWLVSEDTMRTGARLVAALHRAYGFGRPTSNKNGTTGTLRQHDAFTSTACPGPYLGGTEWARYVRMTQEFYDNPGDDDMALSDEDIQKIAKAVWEYGLASRNKDANEGKIYPAGDYLTNDNANIWALKRASGKA